MLKVSPVKTVLMSQEPSVKKRGNDSQLLRFGVSSQKKSPFTVPQLRNTLTLAASFLLGVATTYVYQKANQPAPDAQKVTQAEPAEQVVSMSGIPHRVLWEENQWAILNEKDNKHYRIKGKTPEGTKTIYETLAEWVPISITADVKPVVRVNVTGKLDNQDPKNPCITVDVLKRLSVTWP